MSITIETHIIKRGENTLQIPKGLEIKELIVVAGDARLVTMGDHNTETEERFFSYIGCGEKLPQEMGISWEYIGSISSGTFLTHVVECVN